MSDITKAELSAKLTGDVKTWWDAAPDLPGTVTMAELFSRLLTGGFLAQSTKNVGAAAGSVITAYGTPAYGAASLDIASGLQTLTTTNSVTVRVPINPDAGVATLG